MELKYLTKANGAPQGKEKVYFACHPDDFGLYFDEITNEIFKTQNCAIYYNPDENAKWTIEELRLDFSQMQLVVIPVTSKFLFEDCDARSVEFKYAADNHIPVLPLMQEDGLEQPFNDICGDLQFLDKNHNDHTALPYEQKFENFLKSVLLGDELVKKVRAAFDAYIFLSYRKKDRGYAQELMRLIHKNDFARDIAIWYDEYLTPGESFNGAIAKAMRKSKLFAMVVTPNLVNEENYVKNVEYPKARKAHKKILAAEMESTDAVRLKREFKKIPPLVDGHSEEALSAALAKHLKRIAVSGNDNDPQHLFFIGLAYLGGIDVETDYEKAVELITKSADMGFIEAIEKLVFMHQNGEGVKRDYRRAIFWQEKLVDICKKEYDVKKDENSARIYFSKLWDLGDYIYDLRDLEGAKGIYQEMYEFVGQVRSYFDFNRELAMSYEKLGNIAEASGDLNLARSYYEKTLEITEYLAEKTDTYEVWRDVFISYMRLGTIAETVGSLNLALRYYQKAFEITEFFAKKTDTPLSYRDLALSYEKLGFVAEAMGDLSAAKPCYEKALEIREFLAAESDTALAYNDVSLSCNELGDVALAMGDLNSAKSYYEKALEINEILAKETNTVLARRDLSASYQRLGDVAIASDNLNLARDYYEKALQISELLVKEANTVEFLRVLLLNYQRLGGVALDSDDLNSAKRYYEKALEISEALAEKTDSFEIHRDVGTNYDRLANVAEASGDLKQARHYQEKALEISEALAKETNIIEARRDVSVSYQRLGDIAETSGDLNLAKNYYEKSLEIRETLAKEADTPERHYDIAVSLLKLAAVNNDDLDLIKKAYSILEKLAKAYPEFKKCSQMLEMLQLFISNQ